MEIRKISSFFWLFYPLVGLLPAGGTFLGGAPTSTSGFFRPAVRPAVRPDFLNEYVPGLV